MTTPTNKTMHDIRNCLNSLRLNSVYLEKFAKEDILDCMEGLIESADKLDQILIEFSDANAPDDSPTNPPADAPIYPHQ